MGIIDDFATAIASYPVANVEIKIVDAQYVSGGTAGATYNQGEIWKFRVNVKNKGKLKMTGVRVEVEGGSVGGAPVLVGTTSAPTLTSLQTPSASAQSLTPGDDDDFGYYYLKIPNATSASPVTLVKAHLYAWDVDLSNLLVDNTKESDSPFGELKQSVSG